MAKLEHVAIYAADLEALKRFYVEALGLNVIRAGGGNPPGGYFLGDGHGGAVELIARPADQSNANQRWVCHLAFLVDDVFAKKAELEKRGMRFETDTAVDDADMQTCFFNDPEGNRCQLVRRREPLT